MPEWPVELDRRLSVAELVASARAYEAGGQLSLALELADAVVVLDPTSVDAHALAARLRGTIRQSTPDRVCEWAAFPDVIREHERRFATDVGPNKPLRGRRLADRLTGSTWWGRTDRPDDVAVRLEPEGQATLAVLRFDADGQRYALVSYGIWYVRRRAVSVQWKSSVDQLFLVDETLTDGTHVWRSSGPDCEPGLDPWSLPGPPPRAGEAHGSGGEGG
jgi:hypothetical protein